MLIILHIAAKVNKVRRKTLYPDSRDSPFRQALFTCKGYCFFAETVL